MSPIVDTLDALINYLTKKEKDGRNKTHMQNKTVLLFA